jgi:hypothetical protein
LWKPVAHRTAPSGWQALAGLIGQGFALEVEILVFLGGRPHEGFEHLVRGMTFFELLLFFSARFFL